MKISTTVRFDAKAKKALKELAERIGISFSDLLNMFGHAVRQGKLYAGVTQIHTEEPVMKYPPGYLEELDKEIIEMERLHAQGKLKTYSSAKELFDDILDR